MVGPRLVDALFPRSAAARRPWRRGRGALDPQRELLRLDHEAARGAASRILSLRGNRGRPDAQALQIGMGLSDSCDLPKSSPHDAEVDGWASGNRRGADQSDDARQTPLDIESGLPSGTPSGPNPVDKQATKQALGQNTQVPKQA